MLVALAASAIYLYGYPSATISYFLVDLSHVAIGIVLTILLIFYIARLFRNESVLARLGWFLLAAGALLGIVLIKIVRHFGLSLGCTRTLLCAFLARFFWQSRGFFQRVAGRRRDPARPGICRDDAGNGRHCGRHVVDPRSRLEKRKSHLQSADAGGIHGCGR